MRIKPDGTHVFSSRDEYNAWLEEKEFGFAKTRMANDPKIEKFAWTKGLNMLIGLGAAWLILTFSLSMFGMNVGIAMFVSLVISYVILTNLGNGDGKMFIDNVKGESELVRCYSSTFLSPRRNEFYYNGFAFAYTWMAQEATINLSKRYMINKEFEVNTSVKGLGNESSGGSKPLERTESVIYIRVICWVQVDPEFINEFFEIARGFFNINDAEKLPVEITGGETETSVLQLLEGMIENSLEIATEGFSARELLGGSLEDYNNAARGFFEEKFKRDQQKVQILRGLKFSVRFQVTGIREHEDLNKQRVKSSISRDNSRTMNEIIKELMDTAARTTQTLGINEATIIAQRAVGLAEPHKSQTTVHDLGPGAQRVAEIIGLSIAELFAKRKSGEDDEDPTNPSSPPSHLIDIQ